MSAILSQTLPNPRRPGLGLRPAPKSPDRASETMTEQEIFLAALDIDDPQRQAEYLRQACAGAPALRQRVDALLSAHERSGAFLNVPALEQMAAGSSQKERAAIETDGEAPASLETGALSFLESSTSSGSLGRLRHYEVIEVVGQGGCGIVLKAFDARLQRVAAIKVMAPEWAGASPARKRFLREARAAAAICHENVVSVYAVEEQPLPFLVMEYVDGESLQQRLDQTGPLNVHEVLSIGRQIASGLDAAHGNGLIHRDIKPANILLTGRDNRVKITDFGLARSVDDASITQSGVIIGTPLYMSPEQAEGRGIDQRSDLFSLGSVLYAMCCGCPPFRAATTIATLMRVATVSPRPIQEINPSAPDWLAAIIAKLHAKDPAERFSSAREVAELLTRCQAALRLHGHIDSVPGVSHAFSAPDSAGPRSVIATMPHSEEQPRRRLGSLFALRRFAPATGLLALLLIAGIGLSDASGLTNFAGTIIRLFTAQGTLEEGEQAIRPVAAPPADGTCRIVLRASLPGTRQPGDMRLIYFGRPTHCFGE